MKHQHIRRLALLMALIVLASFGCGREAGTDATPIPKPSVSPTIAGPQKTPAYYNPTPTPEPTPWPGYNPWYDDPHAVAGMEYHWIDPPVAGQVSSKVELMIPLLASITGLRHSLDFRYKVSEKNQHDLKDNYYVWTVMCAVASYWSFTHPDIRMEEDVPGLSEKEIVPKAAARDILYTCFSEFGNDTPLPEQPKDWDVLYLNIEETENEYIFTGIDESMSGVYMIVNCGGPYDDGEVKVTVNRLADGGYYEVLCSLEFTLVEDKAENALRLPYRIKSIERLDTKPVGSDNCP